MLLQVLVLHLHLKHYYCIDQKHYRNKIKTEKDVQLYSSMKKMLMYFTFTFVSSLPCLYSFFGMPFLQFFFHFQCFLFLFLCIVMAKQNCMSTCKIDVLKKPLSRYARQNLTCSQAQKCFKCSGMWAIRIVDGVTNMEVHILSVGRLPF